MRPYPVSDDLVIVENGVYLPKERTLVISDLQLGQEQQLRRLGSNIIYEQAKRMLTLLERLISETGATTIVIDGDLKHEFGRISGQERKDILELLGKLQRRVAIVVVKGNHDTMTKPLTDELGIPLVPAWSQGGFYAIHGHILPDHEDPAYKAAHTIIIGHVHPAVTITDGIRKERCKCIVVGKYRHKRLAVLPSFSTIVEGSDILHGANSPLVQGDSGRVYVLADEVRDFGTIAGLRRVLG
jgi:hypothetical protein